MEMINLIEQNEIAILNSRIWGTIGPRSQSGAAALSAYTGSAHGLLCHSGDAAYEAVLRWLGAAHGRSIVTASFSSPANSLVAVCVGAAPIFCDIDPESGMLSPAALEKTLAENADADIVCVVADYIPAEEKISFGSTEGRRNYSLEELSQVCRAHSLPLVLHAGENIAVRYNDQPLTAFADAVIYDLDAFCGMGGLVTTDDTRLYAGTWSYHNCGRSPGFDCGIVYDDIIGGDMRTTEFTAAIAQLLAENNAFPAPSPREMAYMPEQPAFSDDYFRKMTGRVAE